MALESIGGTTAAGEGFGGNQLPGTVPHRHDHELTEEPRPPEKPDKPPDSRPLDQPQCRPWLQHNARNVSRRQQISQMERFQAAVEGAREGDDDDTPRRGREQGRWTPRARKLATSNGPHKGGVTGALFLPFNNGLSADDERYLLTYGADATGRGNFQVWDIVDGDCMLVFSVPKPQHGKADRDSHGRVRDCCLFFHQERGDKRLKLMSCGEDGGLRVWCLAELLQAAQIHAKPIDTAIQRQATRSVLSRPSRGNVGSAQKRSKVQVNDEYMQTDRPWSDIGDPASTDKNPRYLACKVFDIADVDKRAFTCTAGGLQIWTLSKNEGANFTGSRVHRFDFELKGLICNFLQVTKEHGDDSGYGYQALTSGGKAGHEMQLWNLQEVHSEQPAAIEIGNLDGHTHKINGCDVSSDGRYALSASTDRSARFWDLKTRKELRMLLHDSGCNGCRVLEKGAIMKAVTTAKDITGWDLFSGEKLW
eukprot:COSAG01_NODE_8726_length_2681_cov_35.142138_1_plen_477_part_10